MKALTDTRSCGLLLLALAWAVFLTIIGSPEVMLFTVPVFMLAAPLALGRYLADDLIEKVRRLAGRSRRRVLAPALHLSSPAIVVRGSRLIAANLAGRAPPVVAV